MTLVKMILSLVVALGIVSAPGCKGTKPTKESAPQTPSGAVSRAEASEATIGDNAALPAGDLKKLAVLAHIQHPEDAASKTFTVNFQYSQTGSVTGTGTLSGTPLVFNGELKEGDLRVWVSGKLGDMKVARRGFFIGRVENDKASGTFAISGNAGVPNFRGTWKKQ